MRRLPWVFGLALLLAAAPLPTAAQVTRADTAAVLLSAAREFQAQGRGEVAEALFQYVAERFGETPAGLAAAETLRQPREERITRSAQVELMVWSTTYGAWLGVAIPAALGADEPGPYGVGLLVGTPAGFLGGRALARSRSLSEGQVRAITFGSGWGSWQAFGLLEVLDWGEEEHCELDLCVVEGPSGRRVMQALLVGGLAGVAAGTALAQKPIPSGVATTVNFGALWGTWFGLAGGIMADLEGDELLLATLLGGDAGLVGTAMAAPQWGFSRNRARLISMAGVIGLLGGFGLDLLIQPESQAVALGIPLATSVAGLALGTRWTREEDDPLGLFERNAGAGMSFVPKPFLTALPVDGPRGTTWEPALGLTLFQARF